MSFLRLLSYNIRKGKGASGRAGGKLVDGIGEALSTRSLDLLLCQEVFNPAGSRPNQGDLLGEALDLVPYYGANFFRRTGDHGNTTLTHLPVERVENHDLSTNRLERRGVLYVRLNIHGRRLHVFNTHLGLNQWQRRAQVLRIEKLILARVRPHEPVLLAGDFNDWNRRIDQIICQDLGLCNVFEGNGDHTAPTWHVRRPVFNLDRIYVRNLRAATARRLNGEPWQTLSDHFPLEVEIELVP